MLMLDAAEKAGSEFSRARGASSITELRSRSAEEIQLIRPEAGWTVQPILDPSQPGPVERETAWAIIDGDVLPEPPRDVFTRGAQHSVPLLTGSNTNEGAMFAPISSLSEFTAQMQAEFGDQATALSALYSASNDAEAAAASLAVRGDRTFVAQNWLWAGLHARSGQPVYHYSFDRTSPHPAIAKLGAFHSAEIPYVFGTLDAREWPWTATDRRISGIMSSYWTNFALAGNPNGEGLPQWTRFIDRSPTTMIFSEKVEQSAMPRQEALAFWNDQQSIAENA